MRRWEVTTTTGSDRSLHDDRAPRRQVALTFVRVGLTTVALVAMYVTAPLDEEPAGADLVRLVLVLAFLTGVLIWQVMFITRSRYPRLHAVEAAAVSLPLLVILFSAWYFATSQAHFDSFTEPLTRIDAVYFTLTVFTTVGFGDIAPVSEVARIAVTAQMIADLAFIGIVAKIFVGAVQRRRQVLTTGGDGKEVA